MLSSRLWALGLAVLVVVAGIWIYSSAQDPTSGGGSPPIITPHTPEAHSPGDFSGIAQKPGEDVTVEAFIDDEEIEGSPDDTMEGEANEFGFHIPPGNAGKTLKIVATADDGSKTIRTYQIQ